MSLTAAQEAEIRRKAAAGIPLTNPTAASKALYAQAQADAQAKSTGPLGWLQPSTTTTKKGTTAPASPIAYTSTQTPAAKTTATATSGTANAATQGDAAKSKREAEKAAYTGWDNDPAVRSLQEKWWQIYIDTGRKDTPEQKALNEQAQKIRAYNNPMYDPSKTPSGPLDWMDAEQITPRDTTPGANTIEGKIDAALDPAKFGSYATMGVMAIGAIFVMSMFRK